VKALVVGPTGVGKTSLLRTLNPAQTWWLGYRVHRVSIEIEKHEGKEHGRKAEA
jgi:hypothetical protein